MRFTLTYTQACLSACMAGPGLSHASSFYSWGVPVRLLMRAACVPALCDPAELNRLDPFPPLPFPSFRAGLARSQRASTLCLPKAVQGHSRPQRRRWTVPGAERAKVVSKVCVCFQHSLGELGEKIPHAKALAGVFFLLARAEVSSVPDLPGSCGLWRRENRQAALGLPGGLAFLHSKNLLNAELLWTKRALCL